MPCVRRPSAMPARRVLALLAAALLLPSPARAQDTRGTIRGRLADSTGVPVAQGSVIVEGAGLRALSDAAGDYVLANVPAGAWTVRAQRVGYAATPRRVTVVAGETARLDFVMASVAAGLAPVEVVVGSRARHTAAEELAVPVDIVTLTEIREQGTTETAQVLQQVAPSVNFPRQSVSDATEIVRPFTMRGLNPDHTLVLVNGRRRHHTALIHYFGAGMLAGSSGVDMNAIPVSAIERLEVLRDGAAAQYGSDAIAGVVNLVLREGVFAPSITADYGRYLPTDWPDDGQTIDVSGGWGVPLGRGALGLFAEWRDRDPTNRAGPDDLDQITPGDADEIIDGEIITKNNPVPQPNHHWGDGAERALMTFANLRLPLGEGHSALYAFGGWSDRSGTGYGYYRQALSERNWPEIYPIGFLPTFHPDIVDASGSVGVRGAAATWYYDVGASMGYNDFDFRLENTLNTSLGPCLDAPCAPGEDGILGTPDDPGIANKTAMDAGTLRYGEAILNLDLSREFAVGLLASPLNVAVGAALRRETFEIAAGEPASYIQGFHPNQYGEIAPSGSQVFPGFRPSDEVDESRDNVSLYLDLEGDLVPRVLANVAARFENYSDFGSKLTGKLALRVQPTARLTLRSAVSTGFRAPSLNQTYYSSTGTTFEADPVTGNPMPIDFGIFPVASAEARALGARDLHEETSTNVSAGLALSPTEALSFTADYFWIALDDRIALTTLLSGDDVAALLAGAGSDATSAQYFANVVDTRTQGVDVTASWALPLGPGTLDLSGLYNYTRSRVHGAIYEPPELAGTGVVLLDRYGEGGINAVERERPRWRSTLTSAYRAGAWRGLVRANLYGPYASSLYSYSADFLQEYGSQTIWDAEAGWRVGEWLSLSVGARNIFDTFPPRMVYDNSFGLFLYPSASPYGFNGRYLYTRLEATLGR